MGYIEIKRSLVWSYLKRNALVYYAWTGGEKYPLNEESVSDVHEILQRKYYNFYIEE